MLVADLADERVLHHGDGLQIAAFLVRLQIHRLLHGDQVILRVVFVVAATLRTTSDLGEGRQQGGGGGNNLRGQLGEIGEVHLQNPSPRRLDLEVITSDEWNRNGRNVERIVVATLVVVVRLLLLVASLVVCARCVVVVIWVVVVAVGLCVDHYASGKRVRSHASSCACCSSETHPLW